MKTNPAKIIATAVLSLVGSSYAMAVVSLPHFVTDSMVVQQQSKIRIQGKGSGNVQVQPSWLSGSVQATSGTDGSFMVELPTPSAGGPYTIVFTDADGSLCLGDIWSGEVWLCSGQSNMEMPVGGWGKVMNYEQEIASSTNPDVRLLHIKKQTSPVVQNDTEVNMGGWRTAAPSTVAEFSSIAYFFARQLSKELGVHVGVIDCTWGGTPAEAWTSAAGVKSIPGFEPQISMLEECHGDLQTLRNLYDRQIEEWTAQANSGDSKFDASVYATDAERINLPAYIEDTHGAFDGIFWLQRKINVPAEFAGQAITLNLGMIDDEDITYFNGVEIARGSGYNVPRSYTVPGELVKAGENLISVRVSDFGGEGGLWGKPEQMNVVIGNKSVSLAGDWACVVTANFADLPERPVSVDSSSFPTVLYNAMAAPLKDMPVKGVLWYQGCANVGRAEQYSPLFQQLISDWRSLRNEPELPFYFMQLAGYLTPKLIQPDSEWAALRQAQADALCLPATGMASAIDIGNPEDIHPKNKQEAARRFALLALRNAYGKTDVLAEAPRAVSCSWDGDEVKLVFDDEVLVDGEAPAGFIVKDDAGRWSRPERIVASGRNVTLHCSSPVKELRYNWADYPDGNLRGKGGLPVTPFKQIK